MQSDRCTQPSLHTSLWPNHPLNKGTWRSLFLANGFARNTVSQGRTSPRRAVRLPGAGMLGSLPLCGARRHTLGAQPAGSAGRAGSGRHLPAANCGAASPGSALSAGTEIMPWGCLAFTRRKPARLPDSRYAALSLRIPPPISRRQRQSPACQNGSSDALTRCHYSLARPFLLSPQRRRVFIARQSPARRVTLFSTSKMAGPFSTAAAGPRCCPGLREPWQQPAAGPPSAHRPARPRPSSVRGREGSGPGRCLLRCVSVCRSALAGCAEFGHGSCLKGRSICGKSRFRKGKRSITQSSNTKVMKPHSFTTEAITVTLC